MMAVVYTSAMIELVGAGNDLMRPWSALEASLERRWSFNFSDNEAKTCDMKENDSEL